MPGTKKESLKEVDVINTDIQNLGSNQDNGFITYDEYMASQDADLFLREFRKQPEEVKENIMQTMEDLLKEELTDENAEVFFKSPSMQVILHNLDFLLCLLVKDFNSGSFNTKSLLRLNNIFVLFTKLNITSYVDEKSAEKFNEMYNCFSSLIVRISQIEEVNKHVITTGKPYKGMPTLNVQGFSRREKLVSKMKIKKLTEFLEQLNNLILKGLDFSKVSIIECVDWKIVKHNLVQLPDDKLNDGYAIHVSQMIENYKTALTYIDGSFQLPLLYEVNRLNALLIHIYSKTKDHEKLFDVALETVLFGEQIIREIYESLDKISDLAAKKQLAVHAINVFKSMADCHSHILNFQIMDNQLILAKFCSTYADLMLKFLNSSIRVVEFHKILEDRFRAKATIVHTLLVISSTVSNHDKVHEMFKNVNKSISKDFLKELKGYSNVLSKLEEEYLDVEFDYTKESDPLNLQMETIIPDEMLLDFLKVYIAKKEFTNIESYAALSALNFILYSLNHIDDHHDKSRVNGKLKLISEFIEHFRSINSPIDLNESKRDEYVRTKGKLLDYLKMMVNNLLGINSLENSQEHSKEPKKKKAKKKNKAKKGKPSNKVKELNIHDIKDKDLATTKEEYELHQYYITYAAKVDEVKDDSVDYIENKVDEIVIDDKRKESDTIIVSAEFNLKMQQLEKERLEFEKYKEFCEKELHDREDACNKREEKLSKLKSTIDNDRRKFKEKHKKHAAVYKKQLEAQEEIARSNKVKVKDITERELKLHQSLKSSEVYKNELKDNILKLTSEIKSLEEKCLKQKKLIIAKNIEIDALKQKLEHKAKESPINDGDKSSTRLGSGSPLIFSKTNKASKAIQVESLDFKDFENELKANHDYIETLEGKNHEQRAEITRLSAANQHLLIWNNNAAQHISCLNAQFAQISSTWILNPIDRPKI